MAKYTNGIETVTAKNYQEAAEKLYGQTQYHNPACKDLSATIQTTYVNVTGYGKERHAEVTVYAVGDKQGSFWGIQAAIPKKYILKRLFANA